MRLTRRHFLAISGAGLALSCRRAARAASKPAFDVIHTDEEWRELLTADRYDVLRGSQNETPFSSVLVHETRRGTFNCAGCGLGLFSSEAKFDSGTGWPSFSGPLEKAIGTQWEVFLGTLREEVHCRSCSGHAGYVFDDGPRPTGVWYRINGAALTFKPDPDAPMMPPLRRD